MTAAIIGLVGATVGALTAFLGAMLSERRQARRETARWLRDRRSAAYQASLSSLTKAASYRYKILTGRKPDRATQQQWVDALVEAQSQLSLLVSHCHPTRGGTRFTLAAQRLNEAQALLAGGNFGRSIDSTTAATELVASTARDDLGRHAEPSSRVLAADDARGALPGES